MLLSVKKSKLQRRNLFKIAVLDFNKTCFRPVLRSLQTLVLNCVFAVMIVKYFNKEECKNVN